tara:strand:- start:1084 stop:1440 length:357 start_codon:yes stop_codon:yes gene_type:complete
MSNVNLVRTIQTKLPAGSLEQVCENAPEGDHPEGGTYRDHCQKCIGLADESEGQNGEQQALCVAQVIASYIETEEPETIEKMGAGGGEPEEETGGEDAVQLQGCGDPTYAAQHVMECR